MNKRRIISILIISLLALAVGEYFASGMYLKSVLNSQMNSLLASHDSAKMASLAANNSTLKLLEQTSASTRIKDTSDAQGGSTNRLYYVTKVDHQNVGVYLKRTGFLVWKIDEIVK
ncbi:hypothetical protein [Liquorilactobacillus sicerae]|uniref:hypothetical protein n=1 Tax=Liquorilactobacillus sicerae TaxID=1416943 RepID=UPI002480B522|nr:hypothetical protein [Liquorilactobacillus sicerae]